MKDFDGWNEIQKNINVRKPKNCKERDIWWCYWGFNIGNEQDGDYESFQRPVLVIKKFSKTTYLVLPLTTSKNKHRFRKIIGQINNKNAQVILSQSRVVDSRRFSTKITEIDEDTFEEIRNTFRKIL